MVKIIDRNTVKRYNFGNYVKKKGKEKYPSSPPIHPQVPSNTI